MMLLLLFTAACQKPSPVIIPETPVSKTVKFTIARAQDYTAPVYQNLRAEMMLSLSKENLQNGENILVWDTTFSMRSLQEYPAPGNAVELIKQVTGIIESKEAVRVSRSIRYVYDDNHIMYHGTGETIPAFVQHRQYDIRL